MRRALLAVLTMLALAVPALAANERQIIGGEQDHSLAAAGDCEHFFKTTFTTFPEEVNEQQEREFSIVDSSLRVRASGESGVTIRGWNKPHARLIVCSTAVAQTKAQAKRVLDFIVVSNRDGEITTQGPAINDAQAWWANLILYVPRRTALDVTAGNGGIAMRNLSGNVSANATSGGISVATSSGRFRIETESGGITLDRVTGRVNALSRDGAIAFKAPKTVVPTIEARAGGDGTIICNINDNATWDASRKVVRIGDGYPEVHLSTDATIMIDHVR